MISCSFCLSLYDLFHLARYPSSPSMSLHMTKSHFLLQLSNIPFCVCVASPSTHLTDTSIICCLCILATVDNDTTNIGMRISFWISVFVLFFFFKYIPRSGITGSFGGSILSFENPPHCLPQWPYQSTFPPTRYEVSFSSYPDRHLMVSNVDHLFTCLSAITCLCRRNGHPCPLLIP